MAAENKQSSSPKLPAINPAAGALDEYRGFRLQVRDETGILLFDDIRIRLSDPTACESIRRLIAEVV